MAKHLYPTPDVSCRYGAPMGRANRTATPTDAAPKFYLRRIPINGGGYDRGGAYWGLGAPLYYAESTCGNFSEFFRAATRSAARQHIREQYDGARFFA